MLAKSIRRCTCSCKACDCKLLECKSENVFGHNDRLHIPQLMMLAAESARSELAPQLQLTACVAQLLAVLVKASDGHFPDHDHLSSPLSQVGQMPHRYGQNADTPGPETSQARSWRSWSGVCEGPVSPSMMREAWATPTAEAWQDKSSISLKALSALRWLNNRERESAEFLSSPAQSSYKPQDTTAAFQEAGGLLLQLLHSCLAGEHAVR